MPSLSIALLIIESTSPTRLLNFSFLLLSIGWKKFFPVLRISYLLLILYTRRKFPLHLDLRKSEELHRCFSVTLDSSLFKGYLNLNAGLDWQEGKRVEECSRLHFSLFWYLASFYNSSNCIVWVLAYMRMSFLTDFYLFLNILLITPKSRVLFFGDRPYGLFDLNGKEKSLFFKILRECRWFSSWFQGVTLWSCISF